MNRTLLIAAPIAVVGLVALLVGWPAESNTMIQPESADPDLGETLYAENCASCHGTELEGQPNWRRPGENGILPAPPHDESGHTWHHGDELLFTYTKLGGSEALRRRGVTDFASGMPGFEGVLSDEEIWHVLAYIKSRWDPQVREMQAERTAMEQAGD